MDTETLLYSPAATLARAIREREVSAEEVVLATLKRIEALNPVLNSMIQVAPESALEQARAADAALARGHLLGPLHGVPFTVMLSARTIARPWRDDVALAAALRIEAVRGGWQRPLL
jgi:Amidase